MLAQFLHGEPHLAAPVGILPGGSGKVLLVRFLGEVLLVDGQKLRRRSGQKSHDGVVQLAGQLGVGLRLSRKLGRHQVQLEQHVQHFLFFEGAALRLAAHVGIVEHAGGPARVDIGADPEAGQRRQVVGGGGNQRLRRIVAVAPELAVRFFSK